MHGKLQPPKPGEDPIALTCRASKAAEHRAPSAMQKAYINRHLSTHLSTCAAFPFRFQRTWLQEFYELATVKAKPVLAGCQLKVKGIPGAGKEADETTRRRQGGLRPHVHPIRSGCQRADRALLAALGSFLQSHPLLTLRTTSCRNLLVKVMPMENGSRRVQDLISSNVYRGTSKCSERHGTVKVLRTFVGDVFSDSIAPQRS